MKRSEGEGRGLLVLAFKQEGKTCHAAKTARAFTASEKKRKKKKEMQQRQL